jgi:hypothetical protein
VLAGLGFPLFTAWKHSIVRQDMQRSWPSRRWVAGYRVGEMGIQTFPRTFGQGSSTSMHNIIVTIVDMWRTYRKMFSDEYDLPPNRERRR